jgi:hypothetical protein
MALVERADAALVLSKMPGRQPSDRETARHDYTEAVQILEALKATGEIDGTDLETLEDARKKLTSLGT